MEKKNNHLPKNTKNTEKKNLRMKVLFLTKSLLNLNLV